MQTHQPTSSVPGQFARVARWIRGEWARGGASGFLETLLRLSGVAMRYPAHRKWLAILRGPATRRILEVYPRIALRHSTSYLFLGAPWRHRLQMLCAHYLFLNRVFTPSFFNRMLEGNGVCLWQQTLTEAPVAIHLRGPCLESRHREGEMTLGFSMNGMALATLAFSLVPARVVGCVSSAAAADVSLMIYVGQVQGLPNRFELLRRATRACHDVLAHDLLMSALAGIAKAWGIDSLLGVPTFRQLSADTMQRSPSGFDYGEFWKRYHASQCSGGHSRIELPFAEKPISAISANHRGRTLRKRALKEQVSASSQRTIAEVLGEAIQWKA